VRYRRDHPHRAADIDGGLGDAVNGVAHDKQTQQFSATAVYSNGGQTAANAAWTAT
jgi:hypothetical protein